MAMLMLMTGTLACDAGWDTLRPILGQFCGGAAGTLPSLLVLGEDDNGEDDGDDIRFLFIFLVNQHINKLYWCQLWWSSVWRDMTKIPPNWHLGLSPQRKHLNSFTFGQSNEGGLWWWCLLSSSQTFGQFHALVKFLFCHPDGGHEDDDDDIWGFHFFEKSIHPPQFA